MKIAGLWERVREPKAAVKADDGGKGLLARAYVEKRQKEYERQIIDIEQKRDTLQRSIAAMYKERDDKTKSTVMGTDNATRKRESRMKEINQQLTQDKEKRGKLQTTLQELNELRDQAQAAVKDESDRPAREYCRAVQEEVEARLEEEHGRLENMTGFPFSPDKDPKVQL